MKPAKTDASMNVALNGVRVNSQRIADELRVPVGEVVSWAVAFPSVGRHLRPAQ